MDSAVGRELRPEGPLERELRTRALRASSALSDNDQRVLDYLIARIDEIGMHTVESIGQGVGVSRAAVVRFARRLGFSGFRELRDRARELSRGQAERPADDGAQPSALRRKLEYDIRNLSLLPDLIDDSTLAAACAALNSARRVWALGNRETYGLALYLQRLLHNVRDEVELVDPGFIDRLRDVKPSDAVVVCTFRPYSMLTLELLDDIRATGASLVIITDSSALEARDGDIVLVVPVESPSVFLSLVPAVFLIEALSAAVAKADPDRSHGLLRESSRFAIRHNLIRDSLSPDES